MQEIKDALEEQTAANDPLELLSVEFAQFKLAKYVLARLV